MISEKINMHNVSTPDEKATHSLPKINKVCAPTPAAPTVFAIVLIVKIAASGLLIFPFNSAINFPEGCPSFSITDTCAMDKLSKTDSSNEHRKETDIAAVK